MSMSSNPYTDNSNNLNKKTSIVNTNTYRINEMKEGVKSRAGSGLGSEARAVEARAVEARAGETWAGEARAGEAREGEAREGEARAGEARSGEGEARARSSGICGDVGFSSGVGRVRDQVLGGGSFGGRGREDDGRGGGVSSELRSANAHSRGCAQTRAIQEALDTLRGNVKSLVVSGGIPRISSKSLTSLKFYREYVAKNQPVIITGCLNEWPASKLWSMDYLSKILGEEKVTIDFTPDGRGDSLTPDGKTFVVPATRKVRFRDFAHILRSPKPNRVAYLQHQNSNFSKEFKILHSHIKPLRFAEEAFSAPPDAVNIWVGDQRSVSSLHRDPYENIYCVIRGSKTFTLLPPSDAPYLAEQEFPLAELEMRRHEGGTRDCHWRINPTGQKVRWIPVDPDFPKRIRADAKCLRNARPDLISPLRYMYYYCLIQASSSQLFLYFQRQLHR
ncbi:hypothetical protein AAMO2058_001679100 [Amorphochlora amoebiformis]